MGREVARVEWLLRTRQCAYNRHSNPANVGSCSFLTEAETGSERLQILPKVLEPVRVPDGLWVQIYPLPRPTLFPLQSASYSLVSDNPRPFQCLAGTLSPSADLLYEAFPDQP